MLGVTVLWGAATYLRTYQDAQMFGYFASDMRPTDTLYAMGKPTSKYSHHGRERWIYHNGSQVMALDFAGGGDLLNVLCTSSVMAPSDCPRAHGARLGMTEDQVWFELGRPGVEIFDGTNKVIAWPEIGLTVRLEQFRVSAIAVQPRRAFFGAIPTTLYKLIP